MKNQIHPLKIHVYLAFSILTVFTCCNFDEKISDASGTFEADEVIVSAELPGKIIDLHIQEGDVLKKDSMVGMIDPVPLRLQKAQVEASIGALQEKTMNVAPQVQLLKDQEEVLKIQLANAYYELKRTENLVKADAATTKQLDDLNMQIYLLKQQIAVNHQQIKVQEAVTGTQNRAILSEFRPLSQSVAQINDQLKRSIIVNPVQGTVLTKYAMAGEVTSAGKALYRIADLSWITLRAYITETQLAQLKINQEVTVMVDSTADRYRKYKGVVSMISDKAEFTPKTIQTKEERANLVYAIKVRVKNDGFLKIGMYGELSFNKGS
ncbi:HlyD family efflux transporter periplasmic adaptor subunit [Pedobacter gandavensis]|uniref:HlyD family secretion protein n=1 Tax=Pedobacter TaxID=84567 RepID=UPI001C999635|nr:MULTISPECIES: HlyD family efflux transporter periplasmic adaptor subunit [Pedobacter]WGQ09827.1 HlyD family efflux transporter periplasmic adaptor subunit [Pedobacter gandavensis]